MKTIRFRYNVQYDATIEVQDNATQKDIDDAVLDIQIPECDGSIYSDDTFELVADDDYHVVIFDENGDPTTFEEVMTD